MQKEKGSLEDKDSSPDLFLAYNATAVKTTNAVLVLVGRGIVFPLVKLRCKGTKWPRQRDGDKRSHLSLNYE